MAADGGSYSHKNTSQLEKAQERIDFPTTKQTDPARSPPTASLNCLQRQVELINRIL